MSARNNMNGAQFSGYHGSDDDIPIGTEMTPQSADARGRRFARGMQDADAKYVFYTDSPGHASTFGKNVYTVESMAPPSGRGKDRKRAHMPEEGFPRDNEFLSTAGFRVTGKLPPEETKQASEQYWKRYWTSRGGQAAIGRMVENWGEEGISRAARPYYKGGK